MKPALRARAIGVLSQNHFVGYGFTVEEVVRLGRFAYSGGLLGRSQIEDAEHVERALTLTGLQDKRRQSVLIGPGFRFVGTSMQAHEFGGGYKRERYPKRPLMGPSLRESAPHLAKMWENAVK